MIARFSFGGDRDSAEVLKILPEFRPGLAKAAADENVWVVARFFVLDAEAVPGVCDEPAGSKIAFDEVFRKADDDERLRRRIAVTAQIEGVDATDRGGKAVLWAVEIDGASFAVVSGKDAEGGAVLFRDGIANLRHSFDEFGPADFLA